MACVYAEAGIAPLSGAIMPDSMRKDTVETIPAGERDWNPGDENLMRTKLLGVLFVSLWIVAGCVEHPVPSAPVERQPSVLIEMPQTRQATAYTCGVAVLQSILAYNGILYRQDVLEQKVGATPERGTNPYAMMECLHENGIGAEIVENIGLPRLRAYIDAGKPVICFLQAWNDDPAFDYTDGWEDGHYAIAIGYDAGRIYFMDPSTLSNYAYIDNQEFLKRWHDGDEEFQFRQTGIVVANPAPAYMKNAFKPML